MLLIECLVQLLVYCNFSEDTTIKAWDTATKKEICTMSGHREAVTAVKILDLAASKEICSDGGNVVISGSKDCYAKFWHVPTGMYHAFLN